MPTLGVDYHAQSSAKRVYGLGDCFLGVGFPLIHYCLLKSRQIGKSVGDVGPTFCAPDRPILQSPEGSGRTSLGATYLVEHTRGSCRPNI